MSSGGDVTQADMRDRTCVGTLSAPLAGGCVSEDGERKGSAEGIHTHGSSSFTSDRKGEESRMHQ
jgi:hypothetical protein